jgi:hypothetical protein
VPPHWPFLHAAETNRPYRPGALGDTTRKARHDPRVIETRLGHDGDEEPLLVVDPHRSAILDLELALGTIGAVDDHLLGLFLFR